MCTYLLLCRWIGSCTEALLLFTDCQWLTWVDMKDGKMKNVLSVTYNRLHYRALDISQISPLNQEKVTLKFKQSLVDHKVLHLGLAIAVNTDCI
jgi:hypothetical protein